MTGDARLASDRGIEHETVPHDLVIRSVEHADRLGRAILDACWDNPFAAQMQRSGATRSMGRGLTQVQMS